MSRALLIALPFLAITSVAFAAAPTSPAATSPVSWSGAYAGVTVGADTNTGNFTNSVNDWYNFTSRTPMTTSATGAVGGVEAGYNVQARNLVFGVEADYSLANVSGRTGFPEYGGMAYGVSSKSDLRGLGSARARFGYAQGRALYYLTAGVAVGEVHSVAKDYSFTMYDNTSWRTGPVVGGGIELALCKHLSLKAEGLYYDLGHLSARPFEYMGRPYGSYSDKESGSVGRVGVNYRF